MGRSVGQGGLAACTLHTLHSAHRTAYRTAHLESLDELLHQRVVHALHLGGHTLRRQPVRVCVYEDSRGWIGYGDQSINRSIESINRSNDRPVDACMHMCAIYSRRGVQARGGAAGRRHRHKGQRGASRRRQRQQEGRQGSSPRRHFGMVGGPVGGWGDRDCVCEREVDDVSNPAVRCCGYTLSRRLWLRGGSTSTPIRKPGSRRMQSIEFVERAVAALALDRMDQLLDRPIRTHRRDPRGASRRIASPEQEDRSDHRACRRSRTTHHMRARP